jgi:hypothetical protein
VNSDRLRHFVKTVGEQIKARIKPRVGFVLLAYDRGLRRPDVAFFSNLETAELKNVLEQCAGKVLEAAPDKRIVTLS